MLQLLPKNPTPPFDTFYSEHYNRVLNYLKSKIDIAEDAEDVVSDIFLYLYVIFFTSYNYKYAYNNKIFCINIKTALIKSEPFI